jgi:alpha-D-xyloside xylohydrolase
LLSVAGNPPRQEALDRLASAEAPFERAAVETERVEGMTVLRIPLGADERVFGLGLNYQRQNHRERVMHLRVDHYGGKDNGQTHAPVPFYLTDANYGIFVNSVERLVFYCGTTHRKEQHPPVVSRTEAGWRPVAVSPMVEILVPGEGVEFYLIAGDSPLGVVQRFNLLCGSGCLPPKWGLGFWHRVPLPYTDEQAREEVTEFRKRGYPLDVLGLEPGWHTSSYPTSYEWERQRFPDPDGFLKEMRDDHVRVNLWENCYVDPRSPLAEALGERVASHTGGWGGLVPDLGDPAGRAAVREQHEREHVARGVSGYKVDEVDGYDQWLWPDHAQFPSGWRGDRIRQVYGVLWQRLTVELFRERNQRTYGLVRGSNAGAAPFPYVIYNDCYDHRQYITGLCNAGLAGLLFTPEARGAGDAEGWLRRLQAVCLSPLAMINAWADGTKPWSFPDVADEVREVMQLRIQLLPYLYTAFAAYHYDGIPPVRPMILEPSFRLPDAQFEQGALDSTENPYNDAMRREILDQFMLGPDLLVAPLFAGEKDRTIVLPDGLWYDFYTGEEVGGATVIRRDASCQRIPLFVRDGGVIPLIPVADHIPEQPVPLILQHYGAKDGLARVYDDDGTTYAYEQGESGWLEVQVSVSGSTPQASVVGTTGQGVAYSDCTVRYMTLGGEATLAI